MLRPAGAKTFCTNLAYRYCAPLGLRHWLQTRFQNLVRFPSPLWREVTSGANLLRSILRTRLILNYLILNSLCSIF